MVWPQATIEFNVDGLLDRARHWSFRGASTPGGIADAAGVLFAINSYVNGLPAEVQGEIAAQLVIEVMKPQEFTATVAPRRKISPQRTGSDVTSVPQLGGLA